MKTNKNPRLYSCKDEELPVIGSYVLLNVKRDQAKFMEFSPKYNDDGLNELEQEINRVSELVNPRTETVALKQITARLYATMNDVFDKAKHIEGYMALAKGAIPVSAKDFGLTALKQKARVKDAEGTLHQLRLVNANIDKYRESLTAQGMSEELAGRFVEATATISDDNKKQYEMVNNRKAIVQANLDVLNLLYQNIILICNNGKILFRGDAVKLKEYTFVELKKSVRNVSKAGSNKGPGENTTE